MSNTSLEQSIYLDYQASTPIDPEAADAMRPFWEIEFGNPHSTEHAYGWRADEAVQRARQSVAEFIRADIDEIVFTSGATEANNLALLGLLSHKNGEGKRVIVSAIEHKCVLQAARQLAQAGYEIITAPVLRDGVVDIGALSDLIDDRVALVSIMTVNNEIGTIQPVEEISRLCQEFRVVFHTDAAQAGGTMKLDAHRMGVALMSVSAHKLYGPKGIGALYVSRSIRHALSPIIHGGGQEGGLRSGTLPTPLCVGFGAAVDVMRRRLSHDLISNQINRKSFLSVLNSSGVKFHINGAERGHLGNLNLRLPGVDADVLLMNLQPRLAISTGAACSSGIPEPSHVLRAIGLTADQASECVRISFGRFTTEERVRKAATIFAEMVNALTSIS